MDFSRTVHVLIISLNFYQLTLCSSYGLLQSGASSFKLAFIWDYNIGLKGDHEYMFLWGVVLLKLVHVRVMGFPMFDGVLDNVSVCSEVSRNLSTWSLGQYCDLLDCNAISVLQKIFVITLKLNFIVLGLL